MGREHRSHRDCRGSPDDMRVLLLARVWAWRWAAIIAAALCAVLSGVGATAEESDGYPPALEERLPSDPQDIGTLKDLAFSHRAAGRHGDAIVLLYRTIELAPEDEEARLALAESLTWMARHAEACQQYRWLLDRHPADEELTRRLAQGLVWADRPAEAVPLWRQLAERNGPTSPDALELGKALGWAGYTEDATQVLERYVGGHPDDVAGQLQLAHSYRYAEEWAEAEAGYLGVLAREPDNADAGAGLAVLRESMRPVFSIDWLSMEDSDDVSVVSGGGLYQWYTDARHRYSLGCLRRRIWQPGVGRFVSYPMTLGLQLALPVRRRLTVEYAHHDYRGADSHHGLAVAYTQMRPSSVCFTLRAQRQPVWDYARAVQAGVQVNSISADLWRDLCDRWRIVVSRQEARYSDDTSRHGSGALVGYKLAERPEWELRYRLGYDDTSRPSAFYYSPEGLRVHSLGISHNRDVSPRLSYGGELALARSWETGYRRLDATNVWGYINYRVRSEVKLRVQFARWRSPSYERARADVGVEILF